MGTALDVSGSGDFSQSKVLCDFHLEREFDTFSDDDLMNYCVHVYEDGYVLSIVVTAGCRE